MKALKIIGGVIVLLILVVVVASFVMPTHSHLERSVEIEAPADYVLSHVNSFEQINQWSPWTKLDPEMTSSIEGEDGTVGAKYIWSGNEDVGQGEQTLTEIASDKVVSRIHFIAPWEGEADATITLAENEGKTTVTWAYDAESSRPMNVMMAFMDMEEMLGPDYQKGMDNLAEMVNTNKAGRNEFGGFTITESELTPRNVVGVRATIAMDDQMSAFFENAFGKSFGAVTKAKVEMSGPPTALYFTWDEASKTTEVLAGVPVGEGVSINGLEGFKVGGKVLMIDYFGSYEGIGDAHMAMEEYMNWHGAMMSGPAIEEYVTDPTTVTDPSQINTKIYYPVQ